MSVEAQIKADIEAIRQRFTDTQELYREVCAILFFRYGVTPTANKLYQYVRKGSMSAPAEALGKFWEVLREKSRVRIEHPDLPDGLKNAAGDLVAALWRQAQAAAQDGLAVFRAEAQATVAEAETAKASAEGERTKALNDLEQAHRSSEAAADRALQLERDLAAERASKESLATQLAIAGRQQASLEGALADARRDFSAELEKLRLALRRSEERYEAAEKRALLEIDRERTAAAKLQKDLTQFRQTYLELTEQHRAEVFQLQTALGESREKLGIAEGTLQQMRTMNQQQADQLQLLQASSAERDIQNALLQRELEACHGKAAIPEEEVQQLHSKQPTESIPVRPRRKAKARRVELKE